jgi:hypothetical protein
METLMETLRELLIKHGAEGIDHPGGTLIEHLVRNGQILESWGARPALVAAGACHAFYGTDRFATALLPLEKRQVLRDAIGEEAEAIVYLYASCDGKASYDDLTQFRNRFTGEVFALDEQQQRDFAELTAANEIDIMNVSPDVREKWGGHIVELLDGFGPLLSERARAAVDTYR